MADVAQCGAVLLAAGGSSRMGRAKQLLPIGGVPLVRTVAERVLAAGLSPVVVVLGAESSAVGAALQGLPLCLVENPDWAQGMGASLRCGVAELERIAPGLTELIVVLADQANVTTEHLDLLRAERRRGGRGMVATQVGGVPMPPVLFAAEHFPRLHALHGEAGARALLREAGSGLAVVPAQELVDLDTPADYARFTRGAGE